MKNKFTFKMFTDEFSTKLDPVFEKKSYFKKINNKNKSIIYYKNVPETEGVAFQFSWLQFDDCFLVKIDLKSINRKIKHVDINCLYQLINDMNYLIFENYQQLHDFIISFVKYLQDGFLGEIEEIVLFDFSIENSIKNNIVPFLELYDFVLNKNNNNKIYSNLIFNSMIKEKIYIFNFNKSDYNKINIKISEIKGIVRIEAYLPDKYGENWIDINEVILKMKNNISPKKFIEITNGSFNSEDDFLSIVKNQLKLFLNN